MRYLPGCDHTFAAIDEIDVNDFRESSLVRS
jgi:hypothetical protein